MLLEGLPERWYTYPTMTAPLLTTKLYIPPVRANLVSRPRLLQRLGDGLREGRALTLISAPAGFGKTTLAAEWVCGTAHEVAWVTLDEGDNDPVRFLTYTVAALQQIDGNIGRSIQQLLQSPQTPPLPGLIPLLINDITAAAVDLTLVLDDFHTIAAPPAHQAIQFLLENQPPNMHLVISTRETPPLQLAQLRARGQVTEIGERDLRFTRSEMAAFFNQTQGLALSDDVIAALEKRTEGWIAGLQLAILALQENPGKADALVAAFAGDDRHVTDYLVSQVLQQQPERTQAFLRQTAILAQLTPSLCNAVTGSSDAQAEMAHLEKANLLIPLDNQRQWFRTHRLLAGALRATLAAEEKQLAHQRAAGWYERQGLLSRAIEHALASGVVAEAERLIRQAADRTMLSGGILTVRNWLDALPDERVRADKALAIYKGWTLAAVGELAQAQVYADAAAASFEPDEQSDLWAKHLVLNSFVALLLHQDYEQAISLVADALEILGEEQLPWRVIALWAMAESLERSNDVAGAIETLRKAQQAGRIHGSHSFAVVEGALAKALNDHGRRREAIAVCREAIERHIGGEAPPTPMISHLHSWMGILAYEANRLDQARQYHQRAAELSQQVGLAYDMATTRGLSAPTLHALGETEAALDALRDASQVAVETQYSDVEWYRAWEAHIHLDQGDLPFAVRWAQQRDLTPDVPLQLFHIKKHLVYGRLLVTQGETADARRCLDHLDTFCRENGLHRWLITVHVLQALLAERSGNRRAALNTLSRAIEIAAPEGYLRAFLEQGPPLFPLLRDVRSSAPPFVDQLLNEAESARDTGAASQPLIEPLSERELEVLGLIAAGLSNRRIAERLVIAVGTVKRHLNNIYGKLGVHSRTQAVARAGELDLL